MCVKQINLSMRDLWGERKVFKDRREDGVRVVSMYGMDIEIFKMKI